MRHLFLLQIAIAAVAVPMSDEAGACGLKRPSFEVTGFPISPLQVAVLGGTNVEERSAVPTLTLAGMPASPHQIAVLTPRSKTKIVEARMIPEPATVGLAQLSSMQRTTEADAVCLRD
jgi:hypothetical protein